MLLTTAIFVLFWVLVFPATIRLVKKIQSHISLILALVSIFLSLVTIVTALAFVMNDVYTVFTAIGLSLLTIVLDCVSLGLYINNNVKTIHNSLKSINKKLKLITSTNMVVENTELEESKDYTIDNKESENNNSITEIDNNDNIIEDNKNILEEKKKWEDLSDEDKQPYIEWAIKNLYEKQLDNNEEVKKLSREKLALKKMCVKNNEYYVQDLSAKEKQLVIKEAQLSYENDEHETEDDYDYDKTTHVLEQYSDKELKKILPKAVRQFYKMSIDIDELRENLTIDTIEEYRKRLYDGNYSYELLNEEEKRCVNAIIVGNEEGSETKSIKKKECDEKYQTSVRKKLDRDIVKFKIIEVSVVLVIIVLVSLGVFLLNSMALSLISFVIGALVCIGIFANIMSLEAERKQYCPKCGAKGIVKNTSHSENLRINRKEASQSDINSNRGHLTRDNEGHLFIEELVTDVHETNIMMCPRCENQWINYNNRTIKH